MIYHHNSKRGFIISTKMDTESKEKCSKRQRKTLGSYCAAVNCHNSRGNCKLSMFRFPTKDDERCKKWVQNIRRDDIRQTPLHKLCHLHLCSNHFEDSQFMNKNTKSKLIWNAVPTLFDVPNPPPKITPSQQLIKRSPVKPKASIKCKELISDN